MGCWWIGPSGYCVVLLYDGTRTVGDWVILALLLLLLYNRSNTYHRMILYLMKIIYMPHSSVVVVLTRGYVSSPRHTISFSCVRWL